MLFFYGGHLVMRSKRCAVQNQGITLKKTGLISNQTEVINNSCSRFDDLESWLTGRLKRNLHTPISSQRFTPIAHGRVLWIGCRGLSELPTKGNKGCLVVAKHTIFYQWRHRCHWSKNKSCDRHASCTIRCMAGTFDVLSGKLINASDHKKI